MKIAVGSDLHLEFGMLELENKDNADVLVLAGDVLVANKINPRHEWFFENCANQFSNVIYIMGNHEHYHGDYLKTYGLLKGLVAPYKNIHFLENRSVTIGDVIFFGATFWTDMKDRDPDVLRVVRNSMNDFRIVALGERTFDPRDAANEFERTKGFLELMLSAHKDFKDEHKIVVVSHHAPSKKSVHPMYQNEERMNHGYYSDLEFLIGNNPAIKLWVHGHTHHTFDYKICETRVLCNPRGYIGYEPRANKFELVTVEV